jgi:hypothetical protein
MKENNQIMKEQFISGYWSALQNLIIGFGELSIAKHLIKESGFTKEDLIAAQEKSGFKNREMLKFIRDNC